MTTPPDLFRREALEFCSRPHRPDGVLRIAAPWVRWLYRAVLALAAAGLALIFFADIEQTTSGPALVDPRQRTFVAVLPAAAGADLQNGSPLRLEVDGPAGRHDAPASALHAEPAEDAEVQRAGFTFFPRPAILLTGVLAPEAMPLAEGPSARLTGRAVVVLGPRPALFVLLHGLEKPPEEGTG